MDAFGLESSAFDNAQAIPGRHSCEGDREAAGTGGATRMPNANHRAESEPDHRA